MRASLSLRSSFFRVSPLYLAPFSLPPLPLSLPSCCLPPHDGSINLLTGEMSTPSFAWLWKGNWTVTYSLRILLLYFSLLSLSHVFLLLPFPFLPHHTHSSPFHHQDHSWMHLFTRTSSRHSLFPYAWQLQHLPPSSPYPSLLPRSSPPSLEMNDMPSILKELFPPLPISTAKGRVSAAVMRTLMKVAKEVALYRLEEAVDGAGRHTRTLMPARVLVERSLPPPLLSLPSPLSSSLPSISRAASPPLSNPKPSPRLRLHRRPPLPPSIT